MTSLRQRRLEHAALAKIGQAPRKSWLGRFTPLTAIQSAWIKSLLGIWGDYAGGKTREQHRLENSRRFWNEVRDAGWSDSQLSKFTDAIEQARKEGFTGAQVAVRAKTIMWSLSLCDLIDDLLERDDADFIEGLMLETFKTDDPVYLIGMKFYTTRTKISDMAKDLQCMAPWLSNNEARRRVKWCLEIFRAKVWLAVRRAEPNY